jgi:hypothetical protein
MFLPYVRAQVSPPYRKKSPWSESASELYRPSDRRLSAKWLLTWADRGSPLQNDIQNYNFAYSDFYVFRQQKRRHNDLDWFTIAGNCLILTECYEVEIMYRFCCKCSSFLRILWKVNRVNAYWENVHRSAYFVRLSLSKGLNRTDVSFPSPEDGDRSSFGNIVISIYFVFRTLDTVRKHSYSECYTASSVLFRSWIKCCIRNLH